MKPWNSCLKTHFSLIIAYGLYLKCPQKPRCLGWFKTSQALRYAVWKTGLNSSKDNFIAKSFRLSTKRKLSILLNFLFPFVSFMGVFSILKCKTLVLETTTSWTCASHCVGGWHLCRWPLVSISQTALGYLVIPTQSNCIYVYIYEWALTIVIRVKH